MLPKYGGFLAFGWMQGTHMVYEIWTNLQQLSNVNKGSKKSFRQKKNTIETLGEVTDEQIVNGIEEKNREVFKNIWESVWSTESLVIAQGTS